MATETINIIVSTNGTAQRAAADIESISKSARNTATALGLMRAALVSIATFEIAKRFLEMADVFTLMENRLRVLTGNFKDLNLVTQGLISLSQATGTSLEANALLFYRLSRAVGGTGATYADVLKVTKEVAEAIIISGANAVQAKQGLLQLAEGLGSGALRGRQLRSVVQDFPALADIIAKGFKGAGNAATLLGFGLAHPNILKSVQVFKALVAGADDMDKQFKTTTFTIAQGFEKIHTAVIVFLGNLVNTTAVGRTLTSVLQTIADHIPLILTGLAALGAVVGINLLLGQFLLLGERIVAVFGFIATLITAMGVIGALFFGGAIAIGYFSGALDLSKEGFRDWSASVIAYIETVMKHIDDFPSHLKNLVLKGINAEGNKVVGAVNDLATSAGMAAYIFSNHHGQPFKMPSSVNTPLISPRELLPQYQDDQAFQTEYALNKAQLLGTTTQTGAAGQRGIKGAPQGPVDQLETALGFNKNMLNWDEILKKLNVTIGRTGEKGEEAGEKIKGLEKALNVLSSISPLVGFEKHMKDTNDAIAKEGDLLDSLGLTSEEVLDREARSFLKVGNAIEFAKENLLVFQKAMAQPGNTITHSEATAALFSDSGSGTLQNAQKTSDAIKSLQLYSAKGFGSAEDLARGIRDVTGTTTEVDALGDKLKNINLALANGALTAGEAALKVREAFGTTTPLDTYQKKIDAIQQSNLSATDSFNMLRDAKIDFLNTQTDLNSGIDSFFLQMNKDSQNVAAQIKTVMGDAFQGATDALVQFVNTGKVDFTSLISSIEADLLKLAANALFTQLLGGKSGAGATNNLIGQGIGLLFGLLGGSGGTGSAQANMAEIGRGSGVNNFMGFASGGSFDVADGAVSSLGSGIDNRLVMFKANDSEQVTINKKGQRMGGHTIVMNINGVNNPNDFHASRPQILGGLATAIRRADRRQN